MHPPQGDLYIIADGIVWDPPKKLERKRSTRWAGHYELLFVINGVLGSLYKWPEINGVTGDISPPFLCYLAHGQDGPGLILQPLRQWDRGFLPSS